MRMGDDEKQIDELVESLRICSQSSSCRNCMFKTMKDEYEEESGGPDFTCRSALMDTASKLLCDLFPNSKRTRGRKEKTE